MVECNFTEDTTRLMFNTIKHTENIRRIFGFNLCQDSGNKMTSGSIIKGDENNTMLTNSSCPQHTKKIGDFHTQLLISGPLLSDLDILIQISSGHKFLCIGTTSKFQNGPITRYVTCFEVKDVKEDELTRIRKIISRKLPVIEKTKFMKRFISEKCTIRE
jgi:hypothetical protein